MAARTLTVAAVAAAGLLVLGGGTALALGAGSEHTATPVSRVAAESSTPPGVTAPAPGPAAGPGIDRATAERIALQRVGGGRISGPTELDDEDGRQAWEVEITNGDVEHEVNVDTTTGAVLDQDTDDLRDGDDGDDRDDVADDRDDRNDDGPQGDDRGDDRDDVRGDD